MAPLEPPGYTNGSHIHTLIDNFEAYIHRQEASYLQSKLWILNIFGRQHPPKHLGINLKNDPCHQPIISYIKHAEFCVRALDGLRKDLETVPSPRGGFGQLSPHKRSPKSPNSNMKHYKSVFLPNFRVSSPPA